MKKFVCVEDLFEFIKGDDGYFWAYDIDPDDLDHFIQDGIDKRKVRVLYRYEESDEQQNDQDLEKRVSRIEEALRDLDLKKRVSRIEEALRDLSEAIRSEIDQSNAY